MAGIGRNGGLFINSASVGWQQKALAETSRNGCISVWKRLILAKMVRKRLILAEISRNPSIFSESVATRKKLPNRPCFTLMLAISGHFYTIKLGKKRKTAKWYGFCPPTGPPSFPAPLKTNTPLQGLWRALRAPGRGCLRPRIAQFHCQWMAWLLRIARISSQFGQRPSCTKKSTAPDFLPLFSLKKKTSTSEHSP